MITKRSSKRPWMRCGSTPSRYGSGSPRWQQGGNAKSLIFLQGGKVAAGGARDCATFFVFMGSRWQPPSYHLRHLATLVAVDGRYVIDFIGKNHGDRKSAVKGKRGSVRVDLGGGRIRKKKKKQKKK